MGVFDTQALRGAKQKSHFSKINLVNLSAKICKVEKQGESESLDLQQS